MPWTRVYDANHNPSESTDNTFRMLSQTKPCGVYLSQDDTWLRECMNDLPCWVGNYTHQKTLLNPQDFEVLALTPATISSHVVTRFRGTALETTECQWESIWQAGYDGVHITAQLIQAAKDDETMDLHFDVETLIIWNRKEYFRWSEAVQL